ncbi:MAG TPA: glycosyltransferase family 39 protein [Pilimelia sp.]|nr:glycosyltransferase family 39 protein [Pilimelia sp.]
MAGNPPRRTPRRGFTAYDRGVIPAAAAQTASTAGPAAGAGPAETTVDPGQDRGGGPAAGAAATARDRVPEIVRRRLSPPRASTESYLWSWLATGLVALIAGVLRLDNLHHPRGVIFDETYYAFEANTLLAHSVEWSRDSDTAAYVVHPPLGKWLIAIGIRIFEYNEFGWRFSAAVVGILSVIILTRTARLMFGSTVLGCAAGLLMAVDGMHLVLSRHALLDIFLMFFIVAAFGAAVMDRISRRRRWLRALENGLDPTGKGWRVGLPFAVPWWRLLTFVLLGAALGVKWSAAFFVPAFIALIYFWEARTRRSAGVARPWLGAAAYEVGWFALGGVLLVGAYLACWTGWFMTDYGYFRNWLADNGRQQPPVIGALRNLWEYHRAAFDFHETLVSSHPYQSWPWQWLLLGRPVAFHYLEDSACGAERCSQTILLLGTPVLWWSFLPALGALAWLGIARRDWRAGAIWMMVAAALLPWFWYAIVNGRTMFYFYALPAEPFLVLAVVFVLGAIMSPAPSRAPAAGGLTVPSGPSDARRLTGGVIAGVFLLLVVLCFAYFYPIYVGQSISYDDWMKRMWLDSRWI